jgi:hypothetical protein
MAELGCNGSDFWAWQRSAIVDFRYFLIKPTMTSRETEISTKKGSE